MDPAWILIANERLEEEEKRFFLDDFLTLSPGKFDINIIRGRKGVFAKLPESEEEKEVIEGALIRIRFYQFTACIPVFVWGSKWGLQKSRFWPHLTPDTFQASSWSKKECLKWQDEVCRYHNEWTIEKKTWSSLFELLLWLVENSRIQGTLTFKSFQGHNGVVGLKSEKVLFCQAREMRGREALFEMLTWSGGDFSWEPILSTHDLNIDVDEPLWDILDEYCTMLNEYRYIFKFINDMSDRLVFNPNNSALDDKADHYFDAYIQICKLIDNKKSIEEIISTASLSAIRSLGYLYRLLCFGDVSVMPVSEKEGPKLDEDVSKDVFVVSLQPLQKLRVLIVDDAPFFQKVIQRILERDYRFEVAGVAQDGIECLEKLETCNPDVITLDIEMPRLDGLGALKRIMIRHPKPVVVLSAFTGETSRLTYESFKFGAVDVIEKPKNFSATDLERQEQEILERIARTARVQIDQLTYVRKRCELQDPVPTDSYGRKVMLLNYFGEGSFSLFLKSFSLGDWVSLASAAVCVLPLTTPALEQMYRYMVEDFALPLEMVSLEKVVLIKPGKIYLLGSDRLPRVILDENGLVLSYKNAENLNIKEFIELLVKMAVQPGIYTPIVSVLSGLSHVAETLIRVAGYGAGVAYLSPQKCLFPDLGEVLRRASIGYEVGSVEEMVSLWMNPGSLAAMTLQKGLKERLMYGREAENVD